MISRLITEHPEAAKRSYIHIKEKYEKIGMKMGDEILPFQLTAMVLDPTQHEEIKRSSEIMHRIIEKIGNELSGADLADNNKKYASNSVFSRLDTFFNGTSMKFLEINCESPSGIGRMHHIDDIFLNTEIFGKTEGLRSVGDMREDLLQEIIQIAQESGISKTSLSIAFVDWKDVKTICDQDYLIEHFNSRGHDSFTCDPRDLVYDNKLTYKGKHIDIVFKRALLEELARKGCGDLMEALRNGVCMFNPLVCTKLNDKHIINELSLGSYDHLLDNEELALVDETIPWSRDLVSGRTSGINGENIDLMEYAIQNKNRFVIKPRKGHGGQGVHIGIETEPEAWNEILGKKDCVIQEFIDIPTVDVPDFDSGLKFRKKFVNLCPFVIGGKMKGYMARLSDDRIINTGTGGGVIPTFIRNS